MKKILVISWFYPPVNSSEGLVTYKLLKNSKKTYDVCMQANNDSWSYGIDECLPESENVHCICSKSKTLVEWHKEVVRYFQQNKDKYDIVMTRSMPPESHKVGLEIKKINPEVKWIASFGDPIANNPFVLKSINQLSPYSLQNRYLRPMGLKEMVSPKRMIKDVVWNARQNRNRTPFLEECKLEKDIITSSDYMIFNSSYQKDYMLKDYDEKTKKRGVVFPHSYDQSLYKESIEEQSDKKIRMVYVGHLDDTRTPHLLFKSIKMLKKKVPTLAEHVEFYFYGNMSAKEKLYLIDNELLDVVFIKRPVDYKKSLEIMKSADWLLHIDANLHDVLDENIFFAAKLADYIGADRPIMGITMFDGPSMDILTEVGALITSYSAEEIKTYLYLIIFKNYTISINKEAAKKYDAKRVAEEFDSFINRI